MEIRYGLNPKDIQNYSTEKLRQEFLIGGLFAPGEIKLVYSHMDRMIAGSVCPLDPLELTAGNELRAQYFLERREMGIINIGAEGTVTVDGTDYVLGPRDGLYIGMSAKTIRFSSKDSTCPAKFYLNSAPAHQSYPTCKIDIAAAEPARMGSREECNERTIYKYIHPMGVKSCQLVMGLTQLEPGSVWNTMPTHTHERRMEVYFYFNVPEDAAVFHYMGQPNETRHIVMGNEQAVISPSWSIHSGCGTRNYAFIWGMAGENQVFADMDAVSMKDMR